MPDNRCPSCGAELPEETGQHAVSPSAGAVACPSCGATVTLERPDDPQQVSAAEGDVPAAEAAPPGRSGQGEYFSGEESIQGVMEELSDKEGGPHE